MNNLRRAAEMALEVMEVIIGSSKVDEAKEALRQALAQPEQEPVAWLYQTAYGDKFIHKKEQAAFHEPNGTFTPLYTTPPKREWQGLTDEEIEQCFVFDWSGEFYANWRKETYEAIKDKLKEKNT